MIRRTTVDIDQELLSRAKRALGLSTTRATVEESLRRAAETAEGEHAERRGRQQAYLRSLPERVDVAVLESEEMWR